MALLLGHVANFETLKRAHDNGDLALMECTDNKTGEPVAVICCVQREENGDFLMVPIARMFNGNPYGGLVPPSL